MNVLKTATLALSIAAVLVGSTASAQADKPKVAVLGLEVIDDGGGIDAKIAQLATDLTDALRRRAKAAAGPFRLAPNSNKDLLEMKLLSNCSNEARGCMAEIGRELNAERLIYGKVERRRQGFQVTLKLLNVNKKKMERSTTDVIGFDGTGEAAINKWSMQLYNRLTGQPGEGALLVRANVDTGVVYLNGEVKGSLAGGTVQIRGLPEGQHELRVESEGRAPYSMDVTIKGGETAELDVELASAAVVSSDTVERPGGTSRVMFWTTAVMTAAGATAFTITGLQVQGLKEDAEQEISAADDVDWGDVAQVTCGDVYNDNIETSGEGADQLKTVRDLCDQGESRALLTNVLIGATAASALAAGYFYYKGYIAAGNSGGVERASKRSNQATVQITPTILPTYVGAGIQIDF